MNATNYIFNRIGYVFIDEDILTRALTHKSFDKHWNYETMECIGDSLFNFILKDYLRKEYNFQYSDIARVYDSLVANKNLAKILLHIFPDIIHYINMEDKRNIGGKKLADIFEAIIGAIYLDSDDVNCVQTIVHTIIDRYLTDNNIVITREPTQNIMYNKIRLIEYLQHKYHDNPKFTYENVYIKNIPKFSGKICIRDNVIYSSSMFHNSKKEADIEVINSYMTAKQISFQ